MKFIKRKELKGGKGFTLMELMVVMLIIGLIAAYSVPRYLSSIRTAKLGQVIANYDAVRAEVASAYYAPGYTASDVEKEVLDNFGDGGANPLTNPFGGTAVIGSDGTVAAGVVKVDGTTVADRVTITAYDDTPVAITGYTPTIYDPKS